MIAGIGAVMACTASPGNHSLARIKRAIQSAHAKDGNREGVEDLLSASDGCPRTIAVFVAMSGQVLPGGEQVEDVGIEGCSGEIETERIIDSDEEVLLGKRDWTTGCAIVRQGASAR